MSALFRLASLIRNLFRRSRVEREMDAEITSFVQMLADDNMRAGMSPEAARRAARLEVQGVEQVKEEVRGVLAGALLESVVRDLRFGLRMLLKHPVLSLSVILTFGLGVGPPAFVFGLTESLLWSDPPFEDAARIMALGSRDSSRDGRFGIDVRARDFLDLREQQRVFERLGAFSHSRDVNVAGAGGMLESRLATSFSAGVFEQLRVRPVLGRTFGADDERPGAEPVTVVSYRLWRERLGGASDVLGRELRVHGTVRTIVGVLPDGFAFPRGVDLWLPLSVDSSASRAADGPYYRVIGRLREGISPAQGQAQVSTLASRLDRRGTRGDTLPTLTAMPWGAAWRSYSGAESVPALFVALFAAGLGVLLVAGVNVANLLLSRESARRHEIAVRMALGASRGRVARQLVTEVAMLAAAGAALGLVLALSGLKWFTSLASADANEVFEFGAFGLDWRVFSFALGAALAAGIGASLVPALRTARSGAAGVLSAGGRGGSALRTSRLSSILLVAETAASCALLVFSGLVFQSTLRLTRATIPFEPDSILTARLVLPRADYPDSAAIAAFQGRLLPRLASVAGVVAVAAADAFPDAFGSTYELEVDGRSYARDSDRLATQVAAVSPGYFETFRASVLQGRAFDDGDRLGSLPVTVVNESFARRRFPDGDPLGRRVRLGQADVGGWSPATPWLTVVGVVPDLFGTGRGAVGRKVSGLYLPLAQVTSGAQLSFALRAARPPGSLTRDIQSAVGSLDPNLPLLDVRSMRSVLGRRNWGTLALSRMFEVFGIAALFLTCVGIYGVVSFSVTLRTQEMGVRMALGAGRAGLVWLVLRRSVALLAAGAAGGLALAAPAAGVLRSILYGVKPLDPVVYGGVVVVIGLVGGLAALVPARRVTRVDPVVALGAE